MTHQRSDGLRYNGPATIKHRAGSQSANTKGPSQYMMLITFLVIASVPHMVAFTPSNMYNVCGGPESIGKSSLW